MPVSFVVFTAATVLLSGLTLDLPIYQALPITLGGAWIVLAVFEAWDRRR